MSETTELMARAAQLTALALCGGLPVLPHGPHYDTCPACEPVRVAQGLADALAAARAEVETLTRDRDGWERRTKEIGSIVIRAWALLRDWWQYAQLEEREEPFVDALTRALAADAEHDAYALAEIRRWRDVAGEAAQRENERLRKALVEARDRVSDPTWLRSNRIVRACEIIDAALSGQGGR